MRHPPGDSHHRGSLKCQLSNFLTDHATLTVDLVVDDGEAILVECGTEVSLSNGKTNGVGDTCP